MTQRSFLGWALASAWLMAGLAGAQTPPTPGNGSGGGGNTLGSSERWRVADSAYRAPKYTRFHITGELAKTFDAIRRQLESVRLGSLVHRDAPKDAGSHTFFDEEVFNPKVEYRLVEKLPTGCRYVEDRDIHADPSENNIRAGCTFGSVTYLLSSVVKGALASGNHLELALLILHERLFPFTRHREGYEVISEFVQGVRLLMLNYAPKIKAYQEAYPAGADPKSTWVTHPPRIFTEDEVEIVNRLPERVEQLTGFELYRPYYFTVWGGLYYNTKLGDGVILGIGSRASDSEITGEDIVIVDSGVSGGYIRGSRIRIVGSGWGGTALATSVSGHDISIVNSGVRYLNLTDAEDFTMERSTWGSYVSLSGIGKHIRITDSVVEETSICNNYYPGPGFTPGTGWLGAQLTENAVLDWQVLDVNCKRYARSKPPTKTVPSPIDHPRRG